MAHMVVCTAIKINNGIRIHDNGLSIGYLNLVLFIIGKPIAKNIIAVATREMPAKTSSPFT